MKKRRLHTIYQNRNRILAILICVVLCGTSFGCGNFAKQQEGKVSTGIPTDEDLKAQDTAILLEMDTEQKTVILQTVDNGGRYQLTYDGTTNFSDKYGEVKSAVQMEQGSIVDVVMSVHSKMMQSMQMSAQAFDMQSVDAHDINQNRGVMEVGSSNYRITDDLVVLLGGYVGDVRDINENDILTVRGIDRQIYAVELEKGHGYLRLKGEQSFLGGWVEVGRVIKPISENMLVLLPEGDHEMRINYHGKGGSKMIHIDRDKETVVDVSDLKGSILQLGKVAFDITPSDAKLELDGVETDYLLPVELEYGVHQMDITSDGYVPIHKYLSVGKEKATIEIVMEKLDESTEDENGEEAKSSSTKSSSSKSTSSSKKSSSSTKKSSSSTKKSSSSTSKSSTKSSSSSEYVEPEDEEDDDDETISTTPQIHIDGPEGVEVYFDGEYKGIAPVQFDKESGVHVITLRKEGYVTRSYTLTFTAGDEDESYSFNELVPDEDWTGDDEEDAEEPSDEDPSDSDNSDEPTDEEDDSDSNSEDSDDEDTDDEHSDDDSDDDSSSDDEKTDDEKDDSSDDSNSEDKSDDDSKDDSNSDSVNDSNSNTDVKSESQTGEKPARASDIERNSRLKNKANTTTTKTKLSDLERQNRKKRY